jgi:transglutaminase superfamily protein
VSRVVPRGSNCLVRALAAGIVLKRYGYPSELKIGVTRPVSGRFEAHAWLESGGNVVIGGAQLDQYVPLAAPVSVARSSRDRFRLGLAAGRRVESSELTRR